MTCRDGISLACRIWRPETADLWPVLLMRQPYGRAIASTITYAHPSWYASHGFQVVVQDVRGKGDSGGEFGGFAQEAADGADTIRWARQLEGSSGQVGCYGFSYQGLTQLLSDDPRAIPDCLAPAMAGLNECRDWAMSGGAHWWALGLGWGLQLAAQSCQRRGDGSGWQTIRRSLETGRFLQEGLELLERHDPDGMARRWLLQPPGGEWVCHRPSPDLLCLPMLLIGGWWDPHLGGILDLWARSRQAGGQPMLRIGAWSHTNWHGGVDRLQLAFFQHHLHRRPLPPELHAPALLEDTISHLWQAPAAAAAGPMWGLASGGLAAIDAQEGQLLFAQASWGEVTVVHDPWRPVPGRGGHLGLDPGPCQRGDIDQRGDVACFTSRPLEQPLRLEGRPQLSVAVEADQPSFDLCAALSVLDSAESSVLQLSTGVARCQRLPEGSSIVLVQLQPLLASLTAGQRLRLSLAGAAWPQIAVNPGNGDDPGGPSGPWHRVISLRFDLRGSSLQLLPLLEPDPGPDGEPGAN